MDWVYLLLLTVVPMLVYTISAALAVCVLKQPSASLSVPRLTKGLAVFLLIVSPVLLLFWSFIIYIFFLGTGWF